VYRVYVDRNVNSGNQHFLNRLKLWELCWDITKVKVVSQRVKEGFIPFLLIILLMASLANTI
jgi:hypothetical protein